MAGDINSWTDFALLLLTLSICKPSYGLRLRRAVQHVSNLCWRNALGREIREGWKRAKRRIENGRGLGRATREKGKEMSKPGRNALLALSQAVPEKCASLSLALAFCSATGKGQLERAFFFGPQGFYLTQFECGTRRQPQQKWIPLRDRATEPETTKRRTRAPLRFTAAAQRKVLTGLWVGGKKTKKRR